MKNDINERIRERREKRAHEDKLARDRLNAVQKITPAYFKIEEKFVRDFETPALEEKKKAL